MPRRRSNSLITYTPSQDVSVPLKTAVEKWLTDMRSDINTNTGYITSYPKGMYGKKIKELTHYVCSTSPELNAIKHSRRLRGSTCCLYLFEIFKFLSTYVFPIASGLTIAYLYYMTDFTTMDVQESVISEPVLNATNTAINTNTTIDSWTSWTDFTALTAYIPSPSDAGTWLGSTIQWAAAGPTQFIGSTLNSAFSVSYLANKAEKLVYTPVLGISAYFITLVLLRFIINLQILYVAQVALWNYQELILDETTTVIERAITQIAHPYLLDRYESLLLKNKEVDQVLKMYGTNLALIQHNSLERLTINIKSISFYALLKQGGLSPQYMKGIYMLIKHADEELGQIMFQLTQELNQIPTQVVITSRHVADYTRKGIRSILAGF